MKEFKENKIPLSFYYWLHSRINEQTYRGYIGKDQIIVVMRMFFNIEKEMCPLLIKELELLELLEEEGKYMKVKESKPKEEIIFEMKKKLNLISPDE